MNFYNALTILVATYVVCMMVYYKITNSIYETIVYGIYGMLVLIFSLFALQG